MTAAPRHAVIAAGGTGGHMFPAQALTETLLSRGWRVTLASDERGLRYAGGFPDAVKRAGFASASLAQGGWFARVLAPVKILRGILAAWSAFRRDRPDIVIGFGGYPALPALAAGWLLGLPRLIHEQNAVLGRVNTLFATRVAAVACGAWPLVDPPSGATLLDIGNPVRGDVLEAANAAPQSDNGRLRLLIFGGSQGAGVFARLVPEAIAGLPDSIRTRLDVTMQVRDKDRDRVAAALPDAVLAPFFRDMPAQIAAADLVIARAGASTLAEVTVLGRPTILVPYPHAAQDHQTANARGLADAGAAIVVQEGALTAARLSADIAALFGNPGRLRTMAVAARGLGKPTADATLADLVEAVAAGEPLPLRPPG